MARFVDVSMPLREGMAAWPGDPEFHRDLALSLDRGDPATVSALRMGSHSGTHVESPAHFLAGGTPIDRVPPDVFVGPARVVAVGNPSCVDAADLEAVDPRPGDRLLLRTANSDRRLLRGPFAGDFVALTADAARLLADRGVALVGVDSLSVGRETDGLETHRVLLGAGVCIVEGLDLSDVAPGPCDLLCLPLRIEGGDAAPARVLLRCG